jgi:hypothetical protein
MPLMDTAAQNASLDNDYGATKGPNAPASLSLELWAGDPTNGGVQMDAVGGYAPPTVTNDGTNFPPAADGAKTCAAISFGTSTGEWLAGGNPDVATHFLLRDTATGTAWDTGQLGDEISVEAAGTEVTVQPVIFYNGGLS